MAVLTVDIHGRTWRNVITVLTISDEEFIRMQAAAVDADATEALRIIRELVKRLERQKNLRMKSHLG